MGPSPDVAVRTLLPNDVLLLIFDSLVGDTSTLSNISCVSHSWHALALPYLYQNVDLSCHNNGRLRDRENKILPVVFADYSDSYRPPGLRPRQLAFLKTLIEKPQLASYVKSFAWTLIWMDSPYSDRHLTDTDLHTWEVFSCMTNVARLDLASLHDIPGEDFIRRNPDRLFPSVTSLRLVGWMHRKLVKAIITSLDPTALCSLELDYLVDEGALPGGAPISEDLAKVDNLAHEYKLISDELFHRQEADKACIFPGPMWLPLRVFAKTKAPLASLKHLQVKLNPFESGQDLRSLCTFVHFAMEVLMKANLTLESLVIFNGEDGSAWDGRYLESACGNPRLLHEDLNHRWPLFFTANEMLKRLLTVLNEHEYHSLLGLDIRGFRVLKEANPYEAALLKLEDTMQALRDCRFADVEIFEQECIDYRPAFIGYDYKVPDPDQFRQVLEDS